MAHLAQANRQIAEFAVQLARQRVIVKRALDTGQRSEMAESLFDALEGSLRIFEKHRIFLLRLQRSSALPPGGAGHHQTQDQSAPLLSSDTSASAIQGRKTKNSHRLPRPQSGAADCHVVIADAPSFAETRAAFTIAHSARRRASTGAARQPRYPGRSKG